MGKIKGIRVKASEKDFREMIPIGVDAENVDLKNKRNLETSVVYFEENSGGTPDTSVVETGENRYLRGSDVRDNLTSIDTVKPLSAKQGQVLNDKIDSEINTLTQRINTTIKNTTPVANSELIDIRVGANGKTYSTAGEAVRGQFNSLITSTTTDPTDTATKIILRNDTENIIEIPTMQDIADLRTAMSTITYVTPAKEYLTWSFADAKKYGFTSNNQGMISNRIKISNSSFKFTFNNNISGINSKLILKVYRYDMVTGLPYENNPFIFDVDSNDELNSLFKETVLANGDINDYSYQFLICQKELGNFTTNHLNAAQNGEYLSINYEVFSTTNLINNILKRLDRLENIITNNYDLSVLVNQVSNINKY